MAPTAAMALNGTAPASPIGQRDPLAFIFGTLGVLFVSSAFIRLSRYYSHAGSVFALLDARCARRLFLRLGAARHLLAFTCTSTAEAGMFGVAFMQGISVWKSLEYMVIAGIAAVLSPIRAYRDIRLATRSLLGMVGISVTDDF